MVLAFLQGLALDAYVTVATAPKWAICLDSPTLLDDLQAVLTNLGVVHWRIGKHNESTTRPTTRCTPRARTRSARRPGAVPRTGQGGRAAG